MNAAQAKKVPMYELLYSLGYAPAETRKGGNEVWYNSPFRSEAEPSFKIRLDQNVWYDFGEGEGGNILDFVMKFKNCGFSDALSYLGNASLKSTPIFITPFKNPAEDTLNIFNLQSPLIINIRPVYHFALKEYLKERCIEPGVGYKYLKEINYKVGESSYFALGFPNRSNGSTNTTPVTATAGGNGNGNNAIEGHNTVPTCTQGSMGGAAGNFNYNGFGGEIANFFVHLSNVNFIKGSFNQPTIPQEAGVSFPEMPVGNGMIAISDSGIVYWVLGTPVTISNLSDIIGNRLSPKNAYAIDQKLDDGNSTQGIIQAVSAYNWVFTIASPGASSCIFTDGTYNILGTVKNSEICTIRIL